MEIKKELTQEELKEILGGTIDESATLLAELMCAGYDGRKFIKNNYEENGRTDLINIEALQEFFASKGYKFIPGFGEKQNIFVGPDGLKYGNDYIVYLLKNGQL